MNVTVHTVVLAALIAAGAMAQTPSPTPPVDVERLGPQVGQTVPDFSAVDQFGRTQTLKSIMGPNGAMLIFNRSADWWPFCRAQLVELQARYGELRNLGLGVASITYDPPPLIKQFADERKIEFPLLSDQDHTIVERYGILNRQYRPGERNYGIPHPGTFILDRDGRVVARYFEEEFQYRNTAASIALKIGRPVPGTAAPNRQSTPSLDLATFLTDQAVAPGHRFSIVLDVTPKPGTRVVGPGQHGYRVVALRLEASDNLRTYRMSYPPSAELTVAVRNERLPVYTQPFRLVQDVAVVVNNETRQLAKTPGATFTLRGVLEYQTCTESSCSEAQQVPLSWTVRLMPLG